MSVTPQKNKNNVFLNQKQNDMNKHKDNKISFEKNTNKNRFSNDGSRIEKEKEVNINDSDLFPSLLDDFELFVISKKIKKQEEISYKDIANHFYKPHKKEETDDVDPGWVFLYKDLNHKINFLYGKKTEKCLEIEIKETRIKKKKELDELNTYIRDIEEDRLLRMELYGNYYNFYRPEADKYYTKEENIVIYTSNSSDLSDSDTEGSCENEDYINDDNYL
jgi:hypothetical protein